MFENKDYQSLPKRDKIDLRFLRIIIMHMPDETIYEGTVDISDGVEKTALGFLLREMQSNVKVQSLVEKEYNGDIEEAAKHFQIIKRSLNKKEKKKRRIKPNSKCICGSGERFKNCCSIRNKSK